MTTNENGESNGERDHSLEAALDAALGRTLVPPTVTSQFRTRLHAALARTHEPDLADVRSRLECEKRAGLAELESNYVRLRRRTLGTMIGAAFAMGAAVAIAYPWMQARFGTWAPVVIASLGAASGLMIEFGRSLWRGAGEAA